MSLEKAKEEIENLSKEKEALIELSTEKDNKIKQLELELTRYKMARWGQSTEKIKDDPNQLNLFEDKDTIHKENEIEDIEITKSVKTKHRQIREKNPTWKNLPIQEIIRDPEEKNDPRYEYAGNEISYKLAVVSEKVYVKKIIRNKYALKKNLQGSESVKNLSTVVIAPIDSTPIPKSMADASLLSDIILQKYVYHMPFYRISKKYKNMGVDISPSTIGDWFAKVCELFRPLYKLLKEQVLSTDYIQIDETTLPVIDDEKHRARKGYIWAVNDPIHKNVFFYYDRGSRATYVAQHLLVDFNGAVQSDGYNVYNSFEKYTNLTMLGCLAHCRRKIFESRIENEELATCALDQIRLLYAVESEADNANLSYDERKKLREEKSLPIFKNLKEWLLKTEGTVLPNSLIGKAISYTLNIYPKLIRTTCSGKYNLDNNKVENVIRPIAQGRRNFMFCGNDKAAIRAAIMYSFIGTCRASDINPVDWFADVLNKLLEYTSSGADMTPLLPNNWQLTQIKAK